MSQDGEMAIELGNILATAKQMRALIDSAELPPEKKVGYLRLHVLEIERSMEAVCDTLPAESRAAIYAVEEKLGRRPGDASATA